jgi:hypothetical protein
MDLVQSVHDPSMPISGNDQPSWVPRPGQDSGLPLCSPAIIGIVHSASFTCWLSKILNTRLSLGRSVPCRLNRGSQCLGTCIRRAFHFLCIQLMYAHAGKASNLLKAIAAIPITPREFYDVGVRELWKENVQAYRSGMKPLKIGRWDTSSQTN